MIKLIGDFTGNHEYRNFLKDFNFSELAQRHHQVEHHHVEVDGVYIRAIFLFHDYIDFLINSSLIDGLLATWRNKITVEKVSNNDTNAEIFERTSDT